MDSIAFTCNLLLSLFCLSFVGATEWCYEHPKCGPSTWNKLGTNMCNGTRQSPIDIIQKNTARNSSLNEFSFKGYDNAAKLIETENNGHTVEVKLDKGVQLSGGGLSTTYTALQFHLHWGNGSMQPGSEHKLNGKQYPMELHIVHIKENEASVYDSERIAVLGFFIDVSSKLEAKSDAAWSKFSNLLQNISSKDSKIHLNDSFSLNDLISGVNLTKYYRYLGSLTTPGCNETVVWTIFEDPIVLNSTIINLFSTNLYFNTTSDHNKMINNFRPEQQLNSREVMASMEATVPMETTVSMETTSPSTLGTTASGTRIGQEKTTLTALTVLAPILIYFTL
ncbi:carbonic anhydrase 4 isoform X1 [Latimeria chalumnae]|uniref:carbonic anhydrase 4 isoform X1 n=1 Tax=Latimeria chalumnae TaxID=7897 RepID=UPI0003C13B2A|nr:PREDICTED: carbonic anhydrase 4-like isoform X1 [Latimeria chalumnae]XP_006000913.1 PREDICTED: carbonic anhydrase 4-like isoform X1 [Latimeria chalumnae]|eukprot:XP_006000912.1 PREDICTED: carbonic anhydrase 4-like isoform X1 [Latimeria chalumnae]